MTTMFDTMVAALKPKPREVTAEEIAAAQTDADIQAASTAAATAKPSCLNQAPYDLARTLCAQKRAAGAGQEAVAAYGYVLTGLGAADYDAAIRAAPCDWALLPFCGDAYKRKPTPKAASSSSKSSEALKPSNAVSPPAVKPRDDRWLIIGGVLAGAAALGGVYYYMKKES